MLNQFKKTAGTLVPAGTRKAACSPGAARVHGTRGTAALLTALMLTAALLTVPVSPGAFLSTGSVTAYAEELTLLGEGGNARQNSLPDEAASSSLSEGSEAQIAAMKKYYDQGVRVFDTAGILSSADRESLQKSLEEYTAQSGLDALIVTTDGTGGREIDDYADLLYYECGAGTGKDYDGSLLVMDMKERNLYIYAQGKAARYLTDKAQDTLLDQYLVAGFDGDSYAPGFAAYVVGLNELYEAGIAENQYNYDSATGKKDYAYQRHSLSFFEILFALVIAFLAGWLPMVFVRRKYAMKTEKRMAENFRLAYRTDAKFAFSAGSGNDRLVNRYVTTARIQRSSTSSNRTGSDGSFGGGRTTMSSGRGGRMHTGSGRKF